LRAGKLNEANPDILISLILDIMKAAKKYLLEKFSTLSTHWEIQIPLSNHFQTSRKLNPFPV
jgi:hypothetical protein